MGAESAEQPAEQMSERHDHVKNVTETPEFSLAPSHSFCRCTTFGEATAWTIGARIFVELEVPTEREWLR